MDFDPQDFTGIHVWYNDQAWVVEWHNYKDKTVDLFNPDLGNITIKESDIAPKS